MRDATSDLALGGRCVVCRQPGRPLCARCACGLPRQAVPTVPDPPPPGLAPCFVAGAYDAPLRPLVLAHKEAGVLALARPLGRVLAEVLLDAVAMPPPGERLVLVPVPSSRRAVRRRGHDPVRRTVEHAVRALGSRRVVLGALLAQAGAVADQAGLDAAGRWANLEGRLRVRSSAQRRLARTPLRTRFVVCDDVLTTGATAREAQRALESAGLPVTAVLALAATRRRGDERPRSLPLLGHGG